MRAIIVRIGCLGLLLSSCVVTIVPAMGIYSPASSVNCHVYFTNPADQIANGRVPRNTAVDLFYGTAHRGDCLSTLVVDDSQTGRHVPIRIADTSESLFDDHDNHFILGHVRFRFIRPLTIHQGIDVFLSGQRVLHFVSDAQAPDYEGRVLYLSPSQWRTSSLCVAGHMLSAHQAHHCVMMYLDALFDGLISEPSYGDFMILRKEPPPVVQDLADLSHLMSLHSFRYSVVLHRLIYMTKTSYGAAVPASALLIRPVHSRMSMTHHPVVMILSGGMPVDRASSQGSTGAAMVGLAIASAGFPVLIPDGLGHGVSRGQAQTELFPLSAYDVDQDAMQAMLRGPWSHWRGELSLLAFNQGAVDAFDFFRYNRVQSHPYHIRYLLMSGGMYNFEAVLNSFMSLQENRYQQYEYLKWHARLSLLTPTIQDYVKNQERSGRLPLLYRTIFDHDMTLNPDFVRAYNEGEPIALPFKIVAHYSSVVDTNQSYQAPQTTIGIYNYFYDSVVSARNGEYLMNLLNKPRNHIYSVFSSDCRMSSSLEIFVRLYSKTRPLLSHHYCMYVASDDFLGMLLATYTHHESIQTH